MIQNADGTVLLSVEKRIDKDGSITLLPVVRVRVRRVALSMGDAVMSIALPQPVVVDPIRGLRVNIVMPESRRVVLNAVVDKIMEGEEDMAKNGYNEEVPREPRVAKDAAEVEALKPPPGNTCFAIDPTDKFMCTRPKGHDGDHGATARLVIARWES